MPSRVMKREPVAQEAEQVGARLTENELERPAAAAARLPAGLGMTRVVAEPGMSEGRITHAPVGRR